MRLIRCHIENFGCLHHWDHTLEEGINILQEDNGWGKSTFAAFLCAMFYGLAGDRKRKNPDENERRKYAPWQGGLFGGSIIFESDGRERILTRQFGAVSDREDTCELRDVVTNLPLNIDPAKIGESFFGIDRDSFRNTVFLSQNCCQAAATDDIHARISHLADDPQDMNRYEKAMDRLTAVLTSMKALRGRGGSLDRRQEEISVLQRAISDRSVGTDSLERLEVMLQNEEAVLASLNAQRQETLRLQEQVSTAQTVLAHRESWDHLRLDAKEKRTTLQHCRLPFPGEIPHPEDLEAQLTEFDLMSRAAALHQSYALSSELRTELQSGQTRFSSSFPTEDDFRALLKSEAEVREIRQQHAAARLSSRESARYDQLSAAFAQDTESPADYMARWNERIATNSALPGRERLLENLSGSSESASGPVLHIGALLCIAAGLAFFFLVSSLPGILLSTAGLGILCYTLFAHTETASHSRKQSLSELSDQIHQDQSRIAEIDRQVAEYLEIHGRSFEEAAIPMLLQSIYEEYHEYLHLCEKRSRAADTSDLERAEQLEAVIVHCLSSYGTEITDDLAGCIHRCREDAQRFLHLRASHEKAELARHEYLEHKQKIESYLKAHSLTPEKDLHGQLLHLRSASDDYFDALRDEHTAAAALRDFEAAHDMDALRNEAYSHDRELPELKDITRYLKLLDEKRETSHTRIAQYRRQLEQMRIACDERRDMEERLEEAQLIQAEEWHRYRLLQRAREALTTAHDQLAARYTDPVLSAFRHYVSILAENDDRIYHLDANTAITVDELGMQRSASALSCGWRDLTGFALRIALTDAMYRSEKPPLILDDPFVNLDDIRLSGALALLKELSRDYQVIYLTCSTSRTSI